ncbi:hypothetical protein [Mycoplasma sp. VS31B]
MKKAHSKKNKNNSKESSVKVTKETEEIKKTKYTGELKMAWSLKNNKWLIIFLVNLIVILIIVVVFLIFGLELIYKIIDWLLEIYPRLLK